MIVSCPACSARYRIDPDKIKGRGAKITCPRCSHKFVVYKEGPPPSAPKPKKVTGTEDAAILDQDFRKVGVTWRVRQGMGVTYNFYDLRSLLSYLDEGKIGSRDSLSHDSNTWVPLDSIDDLESYFRDIWSRAERGELRPPRGGLPPKPVYTPSPSTDPDDEAPTTIMGQGHALMDDIRKAVAEATTPPPSPNRDPSATFKYPPSRESSADDPTTFSRRAGSPRTGYTPQTDPHVPRNPAQDTLGPRGYVTPKSSESPRPGAQAQAPTEGDNTGLMILAVLTFLLLLGVIGFGLWYLELVSIPGTSPGEMSAPASPTPPPDTAPSQPGTDSPPSEAAPAGSPSQLVPGE